MNIKNSPTFKRGKKCNIRLVCFGLWLVCKSLTKEQLKCLFSCSVEQKKEEATVKQREQGWCSCGSISQSQSSGMKLYCQWLFTYDSTVQYKDAKITVIAKTFSHQRLLSECGVSALYWILCVYRALFALAVDSSLSYLNTTMKEKTLSSVI